MFLCNIVLHIIRFHLPLEWCHLFIWDYWYFPRHLESSLLFMDWFKIGKGVYQDCILSPCLFKFYVEYIMQRLLCPWNSLGKNTGVGCHTLLQGIFPTQGSNSGLLHYRQILYSLSHQAAECNPDRILWSLISTLHTHNVNLDDCWLGAWGACGIKVTGIHGVYVCGFANVPALCWCPLEN